MRKFFCLAIAIMLIASCGTSKETAKTQGMDYTAEEVELYGYGVGKSADENTARGIAMTVALGDLSQKIEASVRTASSNYTKQSGTTNKTLFESITDVYSNNFLQGVTYKGDKVPYQYTRGVYVYRVEAHINHTILRKNVEKVLDELDATSEEREAFRRQMFGTDL